MDPQIDFINGSLPVPGAVDAMDGLAAYVRENGREYRQIIITCDRHPMEHMSFKEQGGEWPPHCIESSVGAAVWPALMEQLIPLRRKVKFLYKGEDTGREEYSIFRSPNAAVIIDEIIREEQIEGVDICGLAGDVCVKNTLEDMLFRYANMHFHILEQFTASLDGGAYVRSTKMNP